MVDQKKGNCHSELGKAEEYLKLPKIWFQWLSPFNYPGKLKGRPKLPSSSASAHMKIPTAYTEVLLLKDFLEVISRFL